MYTPPHNRQDDPDEILAFMCQFPFATLVTTGEGGIVASHIPVSVERSGDSLRILGHLSKANTQAGQLAAGAETLVIFSEPHSYVSPSSYEPGQAVPTWNYIAVHAYARPSLIAEREAQLAVLRASIAQFDPDYGEQFETFPAEFVDAKLKGIVAFELAVTRVDARWKLSQDRKPAERERISLAMRLSADPSARRLADYMESQPLAAALGR